MENISLLSELAEKVGVSLSQLQIKQFNRYYEMLIEKNKVMNLTAITDYEEVVYKHFVDSLSLIKVYDLSQEKSVLDMGTGAGFPGIPLKIAFPSLSVTLLDSLNKRVVFLEEVIAELGLEGIKAVHGRAEDFAKNQDYRENFDLCVSRAVAKLTTLAEYCIPYIKKEGYFIPYKAGNIDAEVDEAKKAIKVLGGNLEKVAVFQLPETDIERSFVVIKKINVTPKHYPRTAGKPGKEPII
jgi:16S rRNA (guanine527-N7)-methyltransferase